MDDDLKHMQLKYQVMDKSIEERSKAYQARIEMNNPGADAYDFYNAYRNGAKEQEEIDIANFCHWLQGNLFRNSDGYFISGDFIKDAYLKYINE